MRGLKIIAKKKKKGGGEKVEKKGISATGTSSTKSLPVVR